MPDGKILSEFVAWCSKHITGDESGQAQIFHWTRLVPGPWMGGHAPLDTVKIKQGNLVIAAGAPKHYPDAKQLVMEDCIQPIHLS